MKTKKSPKIPSAAIIGWERYVIGRMTYAVSEFCEWLCANWDRLEDYCEDAEHARKIIRMDVEVEFRRDEIMRERFNCEPYPLGHDCDRAQWGRVRELWA